MIFTVEKVAQNLYGLLLKVSKNVPKVNDDPMCEKSPNLVTLHVTSKANMSK
jgi:hypothetical protein